MQEMTYPYISEVISNELPITLEDIKSYLKLSDYNDVVDNDLTLMCQTALDYAEKYSRQFFTPKRVTTSRCFWGEFRNGEYCNYFTLRRSPLQSIESIKYDDENTLDESLYKVIKKQGYYGKVALLGTDFPELKNDWLPIEITFIAGYDSVPNDVKLAMLQHIASMWLNRGDCDNDTYNRCPKISRDIYKKYKIIEVGA